MEDEEIKVQEVTDEEERELEKASADYTEKNIQVLEGLEAVRK